MSKGVFGGYERILVAFLIGLIGAATITYIGTSAQIDDIQESVLQIRKDIAKLAGGAEVPASTIEVEPVQYVLGTAFSDGRFLWIGSEGSISGAENPNLVVKVGQEVTIIIVNEDGIEHDLAIPDLGVNGESVVKKGDRAVIRFVANRAGEIEYICKIPGHKQLGMFGTIVVEGDGAENPTTAQQPVAATLEPAKQTTSSDISRSATDLPPPITRTFPATVKILLETRTVVAEIAEGETYTFWTFNGTVPGPMLRVREGDTVELTIRNLDSQPHSIDLHAVNGPGGGAVDTQTPPGEERSFSFKVMNPGLYVYHCATAHIPTHIANGLYGMILVEPEEGLPAVDREYYVVQSEFYTSGDRGQTGHHEFDIEKAWDEHPDYVVFNGRVGALTGEGAMKAQVGETVRIFVGDIGPNLVSSFHVIGEIFDRVYPGGGLGPGSSVDVNFETVLIPAGSATIVEFKLDVPGNYILVDHAIFRAIDKGAVGIIVVEGPEDPEIYRSL